MASVAIQPRPSHIHLGPARFSPSIKSETTSPPALPRPTQPISLPRRLLFSHLPPTAPLPRLLNDPDAPQELDDALYDFIALALRAFVHPWWSKLTRYDRDFLPHITHILTQVIRALEIRVNAADLTLLLCHDLPSILRQHFVDYRNVKEKESSAYAGGGATGPSQLFHRTQAHMAVNVDGTVEEEYFRQVVDHILSVCLPEEDYEPETERFILREIIVMVIVQNVIPKVTQPWFIQQTILNLIDPSTSPVSSQVKSPAAAHKSTTFNSLVILLLSAIQSISGACIALINIYKNAREAVKTVNALHPQHEHPVIINQLLESSEEDSRLPTPPHSPPRTPPIRPSSPSSMASHTSPQAAAGTSVSTTTIVDYVRPSIQLVSEVLTLGRRHASAMLLNVLVLLATAFRPFLSKYIPYVLRHNVLSYDSIMMVVQTSTRALFPDGWPAPAPPDPTPEEQALTRKTLVARLARVVPGPIKTIVLGPDEKATIEDAVEPFSSKEANVHLVVFIVDAVLLTLFPELGVGGYTP